MRGAQARLLGQLAQAGLVLLGGCSLASEFDIHACEYDEQCDIPIGSIRRCDGGRCIHGCRNNRHCASIDPQFPICSQVGGACASLTSAAGECYVSSEYDDLRQGEETADSMTIIGAFAPTIRSSTWLTAELMTRDFREQPSAMGDPLPAPLVVLCDDHPEVIGVGMAHLIEQLGVRAVVASFDDSQEAAALLSSGDGALLLSPNGRFQAKRSPWYWHLGGDYTSLVPMYRLVIQSVARRVEERSAATGRPARVVVLAGEGNDAILANLVSADFSVGETPRIELEQRDRFRLIPLTGDERAAAVASVLEFAPDLVVLQAGGTFATPPRDERAAIVDRIEAAAAGSGQPLPLYVIGPRRAGDTSLDLLATSSASFRSRAVVLELQLPGRRDGSLRERFARAYSNREMPPIQQAALGIYDALYDLAYAAAAGRSGRTGLSPASVRDGLLRINSDGGPEVPVGNEGLALGRELLKARKTFHLLGATGAGPFDAEQQLRPSTPSIACWITDGSLATLGTVSDDGMSLDIESSVCAEEVLDAVLE